MKKILIMAHITLILAIILPIWQNIRQNMPAPGEEKESSAAPAEAEALPEKSEEEMSPALPPAPEKIKLLLGEEIREMDMQEYLKGVVAAEMPADFSPEALKAQAVAARSYAMYCAASGKHGEAQVCADFSCCQAWLSEDELRQNWGADFDEYYGRISAAVDETRGEYLSYDGEAIFAAFHSSSYKHTEDCASLWSPLPYLISVESPETEAEVPNFVSSLECSPLDFRDCLLSAAPEADFTGAESEWIGKTKRDRSGRVLSVQLGGTEIGGAELRELFSLRSTAFSLEYTGESFLFTVRGFGHGIGMSQYGAELMAREGRSYAQILAHYYTGTTLSA